MKWVSYLFGFFILFGCLTNQYHSIYHIPNPKYSTDANYQSCMQTSDLLNRTSEGTVKYTYWPSEREKCLAQLALNYTDIQICNGLGYDDSGIVIDRVTNIATCGAAIAVSIKNASICDKLRIGGDSCVIYYAENTTDYLSCGILPSSTQLECYRFVIDRDLDNPWPSKLSNWSICSLLPNSLSQADYGYTKSNCFYLAAFKTKDSSYCTKISDQKFLGYCLNLFNESSNQTK